MDELLHEDIDQNVNSLLQDYQSDDLIEKLKMLNYEKNLLNEVKMKPLSRFYFVRSTNPGEQFYMFTLLCWWLCQKLGKHMDKPQEFDDPHLLTAKIVNLLLEMDLPVNFSANKLIRGAGGSCLYVLDALATQVLKVLKLALKKIQVTTEEEIHTDVVEDNAEIILEKIEDEQQALSDDNSDLEILDNNFCQWRQRPQTQSAFNNQLTTGFSSDQQQLTDQQSWNLEFDRVLPQLKVYIKSDLRDWRSHLSQFVMLNNHINETTEETQTELRKLHNEFTFTLEKIESREKHLNNELQQAIMQYKDVGIELSALQSNLTKIIEESHRSTEQLKTIIAENDIKKDELERRGQLMSDNSLLIQIKSAVMHLRKDVDQLNLEVALLVHTIDHNILKPIK